MKLKSVNEITNIIVIILFKRINVLKINLKYNKKILMIIKVYNNKVSKNNKINNKIYY